MIKFFAILALEIILLQVGTTQDTWRRSESSSQLEIGDVAISSEYGYFVSLKNNHHIFHSKDSGSTWQQVGINNGKNKFYLTLDRSYLNVIDNKVYSVSCAGASKRYLYNNDIFDPLDKYTNSPKENLIVNQEGKIFYKTESYINRTDSYWNPNYEKFIFKYENDYWIKSTSFYTDENNYVITSNFIDSLITYKVTTDEPAKVSIYSKLKVPRSIPISFVSKGGTIYFMDNFSGSHIFNYVSKSELNKIKISSLQIEHLARLIYFYFVNSQAEIFIVTDKGVFMNNGIDEDQWIKCHQLSDRLPLPPGLKVLGFDTKSFIKDSMNALISYGDNCGQSEYYCFTPKFKKWKSIQLDAHIDNLLNVVKNKNNRLYAFRPCENFFGRNYLQSDNEGKDWETIIINEEYVSSIGINKNGEALAIATNNRLYLYNSTLDNWDEIQSPVEPQGNIDLLHIYSSENELFLSGKTKIGSPVEKNYLYHSTNGGINWVEIKSFIQRSSHPLNDFVIFEDHNGHWIAYPEQGAFTPIGILVSMDRGMSWELDKRFKEFYASSIVQLLDDNFILNGVLKPNKRGTFIIDSLGNYNIYSQYYENNPARFFLDNDNRVFGYTNYSYTDVPFFSTDLGLNVIHDDSGLKPTDKEIRIIRSADYERSDKIILNLAYDGIYTTTHDIFNKITDDSNTKELYSVFQNNEIIIIKKKDQSDWHSEEKLRVYNLLGQTILTKNLENSDGSINTRQLTQGFYFLQVNKGNNSSQLIRIVIR
ncbi:MAG: T9SS type A sorting domain-containing protein [Saprospiraceae bacterium]|nr:T9SS type A sorting domain-containing protein [Saprospiraceae bacterium]